MNHQPNRIATGALTVIGGALGAGVLVVMTLCWFLWHGYAKAPFQAIPPVPSPRLQAHPAADLAAVRANQARADGYGWVNAQHTVARVPVERAMALLAREKQP